ncbi:alpha/beta hydrolase [Nocardioides anomalus]|uniref:Alpha/beta hydrolase n=1 Tax=Nocardioides anomalus TaxID=2712223 RepID=A0A6G6WAP7_9ACTN|nr:alpha/beta fold hydrolase [Nocardioides anomalus]QIG42421.1 alpha/beta hydrolase [Nocardioides anomalus]
MVTETTRERVELVAGPLEYRAAGPEDGRPVVFVHGFLVDDTLWSDVPERLAAAGYRTYAPTWPLASHRLPMVADADLSPRGLARLVLAFLEALDLHDVVLVGSDTGGGVSQLVLSEDPARVGALVLTNCDAFDTFPPFPFTWLFRLARHPAAMRAVLGATRVAAVRNSKLGFGWLVRRRLAPEESRGWVQPYLTDAGVRRDVASFARAWTGRELVGSGEWLGRWARPVLLAWAPGDPFFTDALRDRLLAAFPDATLVEFPGARTFVALDQPERLAGEIAGWLSAR